MLLGVVLGSNCGKLISCSVLKGYEFCDVYLEDCICRSFLICAVMEVWWQVSNLWAQYAYIYFFVHRHGVRTKFLIKLCQEKEGSFLLIATWIIS